MSERVCGLDELARAEGGGFLVGETFEEKPCPPGGLGGEPRRELAGAEAKLGGKGGLWIGAIVNWAGDSRDGMLLFYDGFFGPSGLMDSWKRSEGWGRSKGAKKIFRLCWAATLPRRGTADGLR